MKIPTTPLARRIAALVHRRPTTPWSEKEIRAYKQLFKAGAFNEMDVSLVERRTAFERKKGDRGFHRRGLYALLNNWGEEVDRGNEFDELHPLKQPERKIIPMPAHRSDEPVVTAEPEVLQKFLVEYQQHKARKGIA